MVCSGPNRLHPGCDSEGSSCINYVSTFMQSFVKKRNMTSLKTSLFQLEHKGRAQKKKENNGIFH